MVALWYLQEGFQEEWESSTQHLPTAPFHPSYIYKRKVWSCEGTFFVWVILTGPEFAQMSG